MKNKVLNSVQTPRHHAILPTYRATLPTYRARMGLVIV